ncbi:MAG: SRPBCC family protein [Candidatus Babeliaceae bacterium]|nr:SRPBCC family protein [Candidatus Babeliaceae bacterium]
MIIIKYTIETTATPAQIWQVWQDVGNWKTWDHDLEQARIDGSFQEGTSGILKFKDSPDLKTLLTRVEPFKLFVQEAQLPLAKVVMSHFISQMAGKTQVTIQTEVRGPLAFFFYLLLGSSIKKKVPVEVEEMLKRAKTI